MRAMPFAVGLATATAFIVFQFASAKYHIPKLSREFVWAVLAILFVVYMLLRFILGLQKGR